MIKHKSSPHVYSTRDRQDAARVLRSAQRILIEGRDPFPALEAARRADVRTNSRVWELVAQAREAVGGRRDEHQLEAAGAADAWVLRYPALKQHTRRGVCETGA